MQLKYVMANKAYVGRRLKLKDRMNPENEHTYIYTEKLSDGNVFAQGIVYRGEKSMARYRPHISLLYGEYSREEQDNIATQIQLHSAAPTLLGGGFVASEIVLTMTSGIDFHCWDEVGRFRMG